jgi:glutathione S-transferase
LDEITPGSLHPSDPLQKAKHRSWIEFGSGILNNIAGFYNAPDRSSFTLKCDELASKFDWVEQSLGNKHRFFPDKLTIFHALLDRYLDRLKQLSADLHTEEAIQL